MTDRLHAAFAVEPPLRVPEERANVRLLRSSPKQIGHTELLQEMRLDADQVLRRGAVAFDGLKLRQQLRFLCSTESAVVLP
jgi:hypothetical protein